MAVYKIGRGEGNQIILADKSVSRQHAELEELGAGKFRLRDLGSSEREAIGQRARARVLAAHTAAHRAEALEEYTTELLEKAPARAANA